MNAIHKCPYFWLLCADYVDRWCQRGLTKKWNLHMKTIQWNIRCALYIKLSQVYGDTHTYSHIRPYRRWQNARMQTGIMWKADVIKWRKRLNEMKRIQKKTPTVYRYCCVYAKTAQKKNTKTLSRQFVCQSDMIADKRTQSHAHTGMPSC